MRGRKTIDSPRTGGERGITRLGRAADTAPGRRARDWLAAQGLLWPLYTLREGSPRSGSGSRSTARRVGWLLRGGRARRQLVTARSDVCIEGFPRSANGYAVVAFRAWNPQARVAHHLHASFQVRRAVSLGVPCCVLLRRPLDAVASVVVMSRGRISDEACYRSYLHFHRGVLPVRKGVVICDFEELTADPSVAVERLNERFGTSFASEATSPELDERLLATLRRRGARRNWMLSDVFTPVPSAAKERRKVEVRARLARHPLLPEAEAVYATLVRDGGADR